MAEDPHVSRLVEAFAFLTARVRRKIDDEFPEITKSLLGMLYPHYLAPFPSCCIARFTPDEALAQSPEAPTINRGAVVETEPIDGQPCRFRTCYPVTLWPIRVAAAGVHGTPLPAPNTPFTRGAAAVVKIQLETDVAEGRVRATCRCERLRFFLHGQPLHVHELYERLLNNAIGVAVAAPGDEANCPAARPPIACSRSASPATKGWSTTRPGRSSATGCSPSSSRFPRSSCSSTSTGLAPKVLRKAGRHSGSTCTCFSTSRARTWSRTSTASRSSWAARRW